MEQLTRVAEASGRILKADRIGDKGPGLASAFLLTFDVGRLLMETDLESGRVRSVLIEGVEQIPSDVEDVSQEEPWWRVIGCPLARVVAGEVGALGLRLQFRADDENPRTVVFQPSGSEVQVSLDPMSRN